MLDTSRRARYTGAMTESQLWRLSAFQIAAFVARRKLSATEVAQAALARLEAVNPQLNAVIDYRPEAVLQRAAAVDAALARRSRLTPAGVLVGVPVTVKCNVDQAGFATSNGLLQQKDLIAQHNSPVVDNLERAGAVIIGRTNTPAFSLRWFTSNQLHGATRNPRNAALTPGGSSGGAASAVAAGIGAIGHGTDIAGSIRYPAYACGVHGLRPSFGRVAAYNASGPERGIGAQLTAVSGPIARHVQDLRLALAALAVPDERDPWSVAAPLRLAPAPGRAGAAFERSAALCLAPDGLDVAPEVRAALLDAAQRLRDAGWTVAEIDALPPVRSAAQDQITLWLGDGHAALRASAEREGDPGALVALDGQAGAAAALTQESYAAVLTRRTTAVRQWQQFLSERFAVLLLPVSAELPFVDQLDLQGPHAYARVWAAQLTQIALPFVGLPALAVATGMTGEHGDMPVGVQLVAARMREDRLLAAGEAIEARGAPPMPAPL